MVLPRDYRDCESRKCRVKQTIYRWWSAKPMVVADAVIEGLLRLPALDLPDTGDLSADRKAWSAASAAKMNDSRFLQVIRALARLPMPETMTGIIDAVLAPTPPPPSS
jgi:hypothetical protein